MARKVEPFDLKGVLAAYRAKRGTPKLGRVEGLKRGEKFIEEANGRVFTEEDLLVYALITDPVYMPEILWRDKTNFAYAGCYRVRDYQYQLNREKSRTAIFACGRSTGKAQPLDAPILTPGGWALMGDVRVGDAVVSSDGRGTRVVGVYPQGKREIVRLHFSDGSRAECDREHLWTVTCDKWKERPPKWRTVSTQEILDALDHPSEHKLGGRRQRYKTPLAGPVDFQPRGQPPFDPYALGLLLGDGNLTRPSMIRFSSADPELVEAVNDALDDDEEIVFSANYDYRVRFRPGRKPWRTPLPTLVVLRKLGVHGKAAHQKSIPEAYLWGSVKTRLALLSGLVDSDGFVQGGGVEIGTASKKLADGIVHLVKSLGGRASVTKKKTTHRLCYRIYFKLPQRFVPSRLERKRSLLKHGPNDTMARAIIGYEVVGRAEAQCIEVAHEDGLYVTSDFVVTHNTESQKVHSQIWPFVSMGEPMLLTAPEHIHLKPLTDTVESNIDNNKLSASLLDKRQSGKTGFTHRPFGAKFLDGTEIIGRIPQRDGRGVKGMHQPFLMVEEGQDYPERGWSELSETVDYDAVDRDGQPRWRYWVFGVHSGAMKSGFAEKANSAAWKTVQVTRLMRGDWGKEAKERAVLDYGGALASDYRRNILGEMGAGASAFFVMARVMACVDQDYATADKPGSTYNEREFVHQTYAAEDLDEVGARVADVLDLPSGYKSIHVGVDFGLVKSPTVISLWTEMKVGKETRLKLLRMFTLYRFRPKQLREALYAIGWQYGGHLMSMGVDATGLGKPIFQDVEDDEMVPPNVKEVIRGYFFNSKVPIGVAEADVYKDGNGVMKDQYGNFVKEVNFPDGSSRFEVYQPFLVASTNYLRDWVDSTYLLLPFSPESGIVSDMLGETRERIERINAAAERTSGQMRKGDVFHILDSFRAMAMAYHASDVEEAFAMPEQEDIYDVAVDVSDW